MEDQIGLHYYAWKIPYIAERVTCDLQKEIESEDVEFRRWKPRLICQDHLHPAIQSKCIFRPPKLSQQVWVSKAKMESVFHTWWQCRNKMVFKLMNKASCHEAFFSSLDDGPFISWLGVHLMAKVVWFWPSLVIWWNDKYPGKNVSLPWGWTCTLFLPLINKDKLFWLQRESKWDFGDLNESQAV